MCAISDQNCTKCECVQFLTFSNCSGSGVEISPEASFASKASMSRSFFLNKGTSRIIKGSSKNHQKIIRELSKTALMSCSFFLNKGSLRKPGLKTGSLRYVRYINKRHGQDHSNVSSKSSETLRGFISEHHLRFLSFLEGSVAVGCWAGARAGVPIGS